MKNILIILLVLIGFTAKAQLPANTIPTQFSTGLFKQGWRVADSGSVDAVRDTFYARYPGTHIVRIQGGDTAFWFYGGGRRWFRGLQAPDTISLSNRINLKLNITDTTGKWWDIGKRWVDTVYRVNDSTIGFTINNGAQQTFQILGRSAGGGGGGSGTVTSVALSMPSAFSVTGSPITTSGTFNISGAGTTAQYIRGNGTLATTDTGMIPDFYLKVRGLFSGTSPITFNTTTGAIGVLRANTSGQLGVATFSNSDFSDNGSGLISRVNKITAGSCTNCNLTYDAKGDIIVASNGSGGSGNPIDTANNGLTKVADTVQLGSDTAPGAPLVHDTYIDAGAYIMAITGSNSGNAVFGVTNSNSGYAIDGTSTHASGAGIHGMNTAGGIGILAEATSGQSLRLTATTGMPLYSVAQPANTNGIHVMAQHHRQTSGTAASGIAQAFDYYSQLSNGTIDTLARVAITATNATAGSQTGAFDFWLKNNAASLARKARLAGTGQWIWDGYPGLSAQTDTTTYKPVAIDGSGNVVKMGAWFGAGGGGGSFRNVYNTDSTLAANRTITQSGRYLRLQDGIDYTQFEGGLQTILPDSTSPPFYIKVIKSPYAGAPADGMVEWREGIGFGDQAPARPNYPYMRGWNLAAGGSAYVSGLPALGESWEPHYLTDPSSPTLWLMEMHKYYITTLGVQQRLESWTINTRDNNTNVYYTVPQWSLRDSLTSDYLFASTAYRDDRTTVFTVKSGNGATESQFIAQGTADMLTINSATSGQLQFTNFTNIDFGVSGNNYNVTDNIWGIQQVSQGFNVIRGTNPFGFHFKNLSGGGDIGAITYDNTTGENRFANSAGGYFPTFYSNGSEAMRIGTSGEVQIGSASDIGTGKLQVTGTIQMQDGNQASGFVLTSDANGVGTWQAASGGTTLYTGDGTIGANRTVTGSNNSLTFTGVNGFRVNAHMLVVAKNNAATPYTAAITGTGDPLLFAYTPTAGTYSKGVAWRVDTLNNVSMGDVIMTSVHPLYANGVSVIVGGFQSEQGNFYAVDNVTSDATLSLDKNFIAIDASGGAVTITLPAASSAFGGNMGYDVVFKRIDNSGNSITIQRAGSDLIDGATSFTLTTQWEAKKIRALSTSTWGLY